MRNFGAVIVSLAVVLPCLAQAPSPPDGATIIDNMETRMRGKASVGEMEMYIKRWDRTLTMKFWEVYPDKSLVRITAPADDAGKGSLKLGKDLWSYDPNIDQIQKIPPSLMLDAWMGSDLTNDDISRSSSLKLDYDVGTPVAAHLEDTDTWRVTLTPKPNSPVVWDKEVLEVAQSDFRPLRQEYYDETGRLARVLWFKDYRKMEDGRLYPYVWRMENRIESGRYTEIRVKKMVFKDSLPSSRFSIRALKGGH